MNFGKVMMFLLALLLIILLLLVCFRKYKQLKSMVKSAELIKNGGISELRKVTLGNVEQYILIEGKDLTKPISLFLHGGPGVPMPFGANSRSLYPKITNAGIGVFWDQRGAGKSYNANINLEDMNVEQMIQDVTELVDYLRVEFNREKIYLVGLSWGSILGAELVSRYPEKFHAYIAGAQVVNLEEADKLAYNWLLKTFEKNGKNKLLTKLKGMGQPPFQNKKDSDTFGNVLMGDSEAFNKKVDNAKGVNLYRLMEGVLYSPDYSLKNLWNTIVSSIHFNMNQSTMPNEIQRVNLLSSVQEIQVPVYIMHGKYDMRAPLELTEKYYEQLIAPSKELVILENSAHNPSEEDMEKFIGYIADILNKHGENQSE